MLPSDRFQDFDVIYVVLSDGIAFWADPGWIKVASASCMILQLPDDMVDPPPRAGITYAYLMQFADGNRIDLSLYPVDQAQRLGGRQPQRAAAG